ncbi:MAG: nucleotide exchange factor GrpE [Candidatus ainarchaeum sp.]|nr:nucleotide exchange factor GrpE [Candidatus ainarchaeum sp.]
MPGEGCRCNEGGAGEARGEKGGECVSAESYKRLAADFENFRRHSERQLARARDDGKSEVMLALLPVLDGLDSAAAHYSGNKEAFEGFAGLRKELLSALGAQGLKELPSCEGAKFDPHFHEAVKSSGEAPAGIVAKELRRCYAFRGQVLRHALVIVGSAESREEGGGKK